MVKILIRELPVYAEKVNHGHETCSKGSNMPFIKISGLEGKVYVPQEDVNVHKKHPCRDCFSCQMCTDDRCILCREQKNEKCVQKSFCKVRSQGVNE